MLVVAVPLAAIDWVELSAIATALLALATFAFVVAAFLQRNDTANAAKAARQAAEAAENSVMLQREVSDTQFRLATYPALACEFMHDDQNASLVLFNGTGLPAFDVDIMILSGYSAEDETAAAQFAALYVKSDRQDQVQVSGDGFIHVYDRLAYATVPPHRAVEAPINAPDVPDYLTILLQFRDLLGRNYCRLYCCGKSKDPGSQSYSFSLYVIPEDEILRDRERIELLTAKGRNPPSEPPDLKREFSDAFACSISSGYLRSPQLEIEERGTWRGV